jgi:hypothetical protein
MMLDWKIKGFKPPIDNGKNGCRGQALVWTATSNKQFFQFTLSFIPRDVQRASFRRKTDS